MFIRNLKFDSAKHYKCNGLIAKYLIGKGFSEIGMEDGKMIFQNTEQLQGALKVMPLRLKAMAKMGGDGK